MSMRPIDKLAYPLYLVQSLEQMVPGLSWQSLAADAQADGYLPERKINAFLTVHTKLFNFIQSVGRHDRQFYQVRYTYLSAILPDWIADSIVLAETKKKRNIYLTERETLLDVDGQAGETLAGAQQEFAQAPFDAYENSYHEPQAIHAWIMAVESASR